MTRHILHIILGLILVFHSSSYAQKYIYKNYSVDEGLPSAQIYDIHQDKDGYIWFATDKGVSRYNGYEFKNFTKILNLPSNTILDFHPQENGQLWFYEYHSQKLVFLDKDFSSFKEYEYNDTVSQLLNPRSIIKSVVLDKNGNLHIGGFYINGKIVIDSNGNILHKSQRYETLILENDECSFNLDVNPKNGLFYSQYVSNKKNKPYTFLKSKHSLNNRMDVKKINDTNFVFIDSKLGQFSENSGSKYHSEFKNPIGIKRCNDSTFFVGYYESGAEIKHINGNVIANFLPSKSVSSFLIDKEGGYWFSTLYSGVYYIKNPTIKILTNTHISSLVKDHKQQIYAGFNNGDIALLNGSDFVIKQKGIKNNSASVEFDSIKKHVYGNTDYSNFFNLTTNNKIQFIISGNNLPEQIGHPLLSSATHQFSFYDNDTITTKTTLNLKILDATYYRNHIWLATTSGLFKYERDSFKKNHSKLMHIRINDMDNFKEKAYLATQGNGVVVWEDSIYNISKKNGLTNDIVREIHIENDSTIWACTNSGLNKISFQPNHKYKITTVTIEDGLLSNDINDIEIIKDTVWVATKKGLCYFSKDLLVNKERSNILSISLKKVYVNNKEVDIKNIILKHDENNIRFDIEAISHKNTSSINYQYRLKEVDSTWFTTKNRTINFPSLSSGTYTFEVKANVFNNPNTFLINYSFKIQPPFWKKWWFISLCIVLFLGLVYLFFKIRVLTYNKDIIRELIRLLIRKLTKEHKFLEVKISGQNLKIPTNDILYVKSSGNYIDIFTKNRTYTVRCKIGDFIHTTPDPLEYVRIHRSYIVRIDKITGKSKKHILIDELTIPVSGAFESQLDKIPF